MTSILKRTSFHYLIAAFLFALYGIAVCPFLDSLTTAQLLTPILCMFTVQWIVRFLQEPKIRQLSAKKQVRRQFITDFSLFILGAVVLAAYNKWVYNFPLDSEAKVLLGMTILGFFIACDLSLFREYRIALTIENGEQSIIPDENPYPLTNKFTWFASICMLSVVGIVVQVINKDLHWLMNRDSSISLAMAQLYILGEVIFVVVVMIAYMLMIILGYARNLKFVIASQNQILQHVTRGGLSAEVPVVSNDEFGLMAQRTNVMIGAMAQQQNEIKITRDTCILSLATLAETRDNETGGHINRTQNYVRSLALSLRVKEEYWQLLTANFIELLYKSAPLHDIGKVGIPDRILLKPGKLTDEEFAIMKTHPQIGADALDAAQRELGSNSFLRVAREISLTHHEKWDGSGYPAGLAGEDIPIAGRLMALADVYDALITERVYKPAFSHEKAKGIILNGRGSHFDPDVVDAFIACEQSFVNIAEQFKDG